MSARRTARPMRPFPVVLLTVLVGSLAGCASPDSPDAAEGDAPDGIPPSEIPDTLRAPASEEQALAIDRDDAADAFVLPDPIAAGPHAWERSEFELEPRVVDGQATPSPYVVIPEGSVHAPKGLAERSPVVVLMHGRHGTCDLAGVTEVLGPPCPEAPPAVEPVDSYTGYDYLAENLASHGYVVASLSANHINDHDNDLSAVGDDSGATARARLLLSFLDDLRAVEAGEGPEPLRHLKGKLDLGRVGLMGHSRGGEGVARAATLNAEWPEPHALAAVFALAPTDFDRHVVEGIPLAVLLPYCDGDVSTLHGAWMYDDAAASAKAGPLHQFVALGANHNWYNTVWTGSDWGNRGDSHCDLDAKASGRDSAAEQREHGLAVMAAFLRRYAGGETALMPYLTGAAPFEQPGIVVTYQPPAGRRLDLRPGALDGFTESETCTAPDCPIERTYSRAKQTYLEWDGAATVRHGIAVTDARQFTRVSLRVGFDHDTDGAGEDDVVATLEDMDGNVASVPLRGGVFHPPGSDGAKTTLNQAWAPLDAFAGVDLESLVWLRVTFAGSGAAQVADVQFQDAS